ncbi:carboxysome shell protein [Parasulfuritortus cantonensis]|uniref:Carboxysome shell protein n=2 Tax=Parasulfuritortus cantonensis TaxID=2528202 RepID=A0A4R1B2M2_9PROT|nr:carboxysome shell protein [Parasulfuritortus cantonensis]
MVSARTRTQSRTAEAAVATAPALEPTPVGAPRPAGEGIVESQADTQAVAEQLDTLCAIVEESPDATGEDANSVRQLCRDRRRAMSSQGKSAVPKKSSANGYRAAGGGEMTGRDIARKRRAEQCTNGRCETAPSRPSGRMRPQSMEAPAKVETGTTLSGQSVTGNQVDRTSKVTGNESGGCRAITGTEYVGSEQFESFCSSKPEAGQPIAGRAKVGMSATSRGQWVSGTEVGRSAKVTGDEPGSCRPVSGTEYLGSEGFAEFCQSKGLMSRPEKVVAGTTERKGLTITGSDEARAKRVTGTEPGAQKAITGSQYADAGAARMTINGPSKVALTHTLAGRPVSGTEVGNSRKVTGDEAGSCRTISGTEYLSNEQFQSVCNTRPAPGPAKVGIDASERGQRITGNLVDRSERVTGNEPGSCQRVTGSQYARGTLCGGAPDKASLMHTMAGRALTGSRMGGALQSPKSTGDDHGGCQPVTGTEYYGQEHFAGSCPSTPDVVSPAAYKVGVSQTPHGLPVSGTMVGGAAHVTGDEPGSGLAISGTPYGGSEDIATPCGCQHGDTMAPRFRNPAMRPAMAMTMKPAAPRPESFSVSSPAREMTGRITGTGYGGSGRITGPVNMAGGLVSGTPEFRYNDGYRPMGAPMAMRTPAPVEPESMAERITGEGREAGPRITGDDWARSGNVTGTEGRWAQSRNPTLRGMQRGMGVGARANKEIERPEVPIAKVTGSSGNAGKGAVITVSGGARG